MKDPNPTDLLLDALMLEKRAKRFWRTSTMGLAIGAIPIWIATGDNILTVCVVTTLITAYILEVIIPRKGKVRS